MIIVTSGHVNHGKTALLQALTGTNTAHLPEEKKRGMTIDLGYAYLTITNGEKQKILGFIDVPGHKKFLTNMLAALGGIDYALLIIAADEGIAKQTREHLAILRLLHLKQIIIVITKADRSNPQQIAQLQNEIQQQFPFLVNSPIFITSTQSQQGINELTQHLIQLENLADKDKPFRYAIDRVFSLKGTGTVVTGTAFAGQVKTDQNLFLTNGKAVRIKNIHAQNQASPNGYGGQRLALNLTVDLDRMPLRRGDWLFEMPNAQSSSRISVQLENVIDLKETQAVHIYHACNHITGKLSLLTAKKIAKGNHTLAEVVLDQELFLTFADKLIIRSADAKTLVGGAKVLEIHSPQRYKRSAERLAYLQTLSQAKTIENRLALYLQHKALDISFLQWVEQLNANQLASILTNIGAMQVQNWCFNADYQEQQKQRIINALQAYHQTHQDQIGLGKTRLYRISTINQPEPLIYYFIAQLLQEGQLKQTRSWLHLPEHKLQFSIAEQELWQAVLVQFNQANGKPLWVRDLAYLLTIDEQEMRNFMYKAGKLGYLIPIVKDRFLLTETLYNYAHLIKAKITAQGAITVNELRDQLNFGRKLTVQLLEYFDSCGFLRRKGNEHLLRDQDMFDS